MKMGDVYLVRNILMLLGSGSASMDLKWEIEPHLRALKPRTQDAEKVLKDLGLKPGVAGYEEAEKSLLDKEVEIVFPKPIPKALVKDPCPVVIFDLMTLKDHKVMEE